MHTRPPLRTACALAVLAASASAAYAQYEQTPPRFVATFSSTTPASGTGFHEEIDYFNPAKPDEKPYAVQRIVVDLHEGTRIDTSVPEQCKATSSDFTQQGADACPPGSRIGGGEVEVDTGSSGGPVPRVIHNDLTLFNDEDTIILFTESTNTDPVIRSSARSVAEDGRFVSEAPNLPGFPPPEPFTAIRKVRLDIENVSAVEDGERRHYLTTPGECPGSGTWANTGTFSYRNGAEHSLTSTTPCEPAAAVSKDLRARLRGVPRRCVRRSFRVRGRVRGGERPRRARLRLDGRKVFSTRKRRFSYRVRTGGLEAGRHRLRLVALDDAGRRASVVRRFRRCRD